MLPWLEMQIDSKIIDGLTWIDREKKIFRVPWKHASRQGWKVLDASIFKAWAVYTDRFKEDTQIKDQKRARALAKTWKANFRCASNAQNDRIRNLSCEGTKKGNDAFKVYQIVSKGSCNERKDNINYGKKYFLFHFFCRVYDILYLASCFVKSMNVYSRNS